MNTTEESKPPNGLEIGSIAPEIDSDDVCGNHFNLKKAVSEYDGVLLNFFRGNF